MDNTDDPNFLASDIMILLPMNFTRISQVDFNPHGDHDITSKIDSKENSPVTTPRKKSKESTINAGTHKDSHKKDDLKLLKNHSDRKHTLAKKDK